MLPEAEPRKAPPPQRVAVYYAPEREDSLWRLGVTWLGRDPETGEHCRQPDIPDLPALTTSPRRYGFHATLKAPIHLVGAFDDFLVDARALARRLVPCSLPALAVRNMDGFVAICPVAPSRALNAFADACVTGLDHHRQVEDTATQTRRAQGLSASALNHLERWGYPFVLEDWRFHMTLSNGGDAASALLAAARAHFGSALELPRSITSLSIFVETTPGEAFRLASRLRLGP